MNNHSSIRLLAASVLCLLGLPAGPALATGGAFVWEYESEYSTVTTPAVGGGMVYMGVSTDFLCLDASTGSVLWSYDAQTFTRASPVLSGGSVLFGGMNNQTLYCLDASTGSLLWTWEDPSNSGSLNSPPAVSGDYVYIANTYPPYKLLCLDTTDNGDQVWEFEHGLQNQTPVVSGGYVYAPGKNRNGDYVYYCLDAQTGSVVWETEKFTVIDSPPAVSGGFVFVGGYHLTCLDALTGDKLWETEKGGLDSAPSVSGGRVYISSSSTLYCFSAKTGNIIWEYSAEGTIDYTQPVLTGNHVYVGARQPDQLICLSAWTGDAIYEYAANDDVRTPSVAGGSVYFGIGSGGTDAVSGLFCIQAAAGDTGSWPMLGQNPGRTSALGAVGSVCSDTDQDGYSPDGGDCGEVDCDDSDDTVSPGHEEVCGDGIDNNCDGSVDEGCSDDTTSTTTTVPEPATSTTTTVPVDDDDSGDEDCLHDGDVDGDGMLTVQDARLALLAALGLAELDECQMLRADITCDGEVQRDDFIGIIRCIIMARIGRPCVPCDLQ